VAGRDLGGEAGWMPATTLSSGERGARVHGIIEQVRRGEVLAHDDGNRTWTSAIAKEPVDAAVDVGPVGVAGDHQADRRDHGGPDKALLAYAAARYDDWRTRYGLDLPVGCFGENLSIAGIDEDDACIGDTWRAGDLVVQVSQPRVPCWKLARRSGVPELPQLTSDTGWTGWYLRVRAPARLAPDTAIELVERPHPEWTVAQATRTALAGSAHDRRSLAAIPELAAVWRTMLPARADRPVGTP
jgi:MOSC domain-containing protein YiiM